MLAVSQVHLDYKLAIDTVDFKLKFLGKVLGKIVRKILRTFVRRLKDFVCFFNIWFCNNWTLPNENHIYCEKRQETLSILLIQMFSSMWSK